MGETSVKCKIRITTIFFLLSMENLGMGGVNKMDSRGKG